jgi:hypothetical protein
MLVNRIATICLSANLFLPVVQELAGDTNGTAARGGNDRQRISIKICLKILLIEQQAKTENLL